MNTFHKLTQGLIALIAVVGAGAWLMTHVAIADASCELTPAQVKEEWRVTRRIIIELNPISGTMNVQNNTECSLVVNILVYNVHTAPDFPTHIGQQTLFSSSPAVQILPGHSATLSAPLPNCYYQIDYFV